MRVQNVLTIASIIIVVFLLPVHPQSNQQPTKDLYTQTTKNPNQQHTPFVTMDKKSLLSGIRIEPEEQGGSGFIGYAKYPSEKGVSIVEPDTPVRVVLFGVFLDEIDTVGFTNTENCSDAELIGQNDFTIQSERRIVVIYQFESSHSYHKLCLRQKPSPDYPNELPIHLIDDRHCWVSTDMPAREYYFPMPIQIVIVFALLVLSGLFSGLNLGLMSLTPQELTLIENSGSSQERKFAKKILPVRKSGNRLLCSLLIGNVCVNSAISILFDDLTSGYVALAVSSAGIVVFGEIFPQALCVKKGLAVGAHTIWVTRFFMMLTFPLAYPISLILDKLLGEQVESYDRKRLIELIKLNTKNAAQAEELKIAIGAFEMNDKTVKDVMTKIEDVFMIPHDTILNAKIVAEIVRSGYTRIPVFSGSRDNVVSLLFVKDLALLDPDDNFLVQTVCEYYQHPVRRVPEDTPLRTMLEEFKKGDYHMALADRIVHPSGDNEETKYELTGLVTLEDIVEEILQAEIVDETDVVTDNVHKIKRRRNQRRGLELFTDEGEPSQISMQMQLVTVQFLEGTFRRAFHPDRIAQAVLEKVICSHVHRVEVSHLADINCPKSALPRKARLYAKKQPSDKFILILEGRAMVTIGQTEMKFEVGPWNFFGKELLQQLDQIIEGEVGSPVSNAAPSNAVGRVSVPTAPTAQPMPPIRTVTSAAGGIDRSVAENRQSQAAIVGLLPPSAQQHSPIADLSQEVLKKVFFIPDYSVNVLSECTYLEISVHTYASMYKTTQISRTNAHAIGGLVPGDVSGEQLPPPASPHRSSLDQQPQQQQHQHEQRKHSTRAEHRRRHSVVLTETDNDASDNMLSQKHRAKHKRGASPPSRRGADEQRQPLLIGNGPRTAGEQNRLANSSRTGSNASTSDGLYNGVRTGTSAVVSLDASEDGSNTDNYDDGGRSHSSGGEYNVNDTNRENGGDDDDDHLYQQQQPEEGDEQEQRTMVPSSDYLPFQSLRQ